MKKNKKGFTLVELMAVLVVLIVILIIAVNRVRKSIEDTEKKSKEANAISYIKAVNNFASINNGDESNIKFEGVYTYDELSDLGVNVSGTKPTEGFIFSRDEKVIYGCLNYKDSKILIENNEVKSITSGVCSLKSGYNEEIGMYTAEYQGSEETFTIPKTGKYLLEVWGAQGGNATDEYLGGYGAYARGYVDLNENDILYINVGGTGASGCIKSQCVGGYNGGSVGGFNANQLGNIYYSGGGGATSIALRSGTISSLSSYINDILIIAGGGGGATYIQSSDGVNGGSGGGFVGGEINGESNIIAGGYPGTQTEGGSHLFPYCTEASFGQAGAITQRNDSNATSGSGGGLYGGGCGGAGGSGYIGNTNLTDKAMYCYKCRENYELNTKTIVTESVSSAPQVSTTKIGHGYARITFIE